jgi:hypothetical protein
MVTSGFSLEALRERMPDSAAQALVAHGAGAFADGFLQFAAPEVFDDTLAEWLGGFTPSRTPFARTALGDLLYIRDLRERASALGMEGDAAEQAHDVSVLTVRYKATDVVEYSFGAFTRSLSKPGFLADVLRKDLYDGAVGRLGRPDPDEIFVFVPALALGGSEDAASLERAKADVALSILFQA